MPDDDSVRMKEVIAVREGADRDRDLLAVKVKKRVMPDFVAERPAGESEVSGVETRRYRLFQLAMIFDKARTRKQAAISRELFESDFPRNASKGLWLSGTVVWRITGE